MIYLGEVESERTQFICFVTALANLRENFWTEFHLLENWVQNLLIAQREKASHLLTSQSTYTKFRNSAMSIQYLYNRISEIYFHSGLQCCVPRKILFLLVVCMQTFSRCHITHKRGCTIQLRQSVSRSCPSIQNDSSLKQLLNTTTLKRALPILITTPAAGCSNNN